MEGLLTIDAEVGDIVMTGQKDYRGWGSRPNYHAVLPDGSLSKDMTKLQAYKHAKTKVQAVPVG